MSCKRGCGGPPASVWPLSISTHAVYEKRQILYSLESNRKRDRGVRVLPLPQVSPCSALPIPRVHVVGDRRGLGTRQGRAAHEGRADAGIELADEVLAGHCSWPPNADLRVSFYSVV